MTPLRGGGLLALGLRIVLVGFTVVVARRLANRSNLTPASFRQRVVLNGFAALPLAMLLAAPSIWEHHFVFVLLPMLVLLPALREPWQFGAWGIAYVFMFLQPVYDVFPVSYTRLVALLLALLLFHSIATRAPNSEQNAACGPARFPFLSGLDWADLLAYARMRGATRFNGRRSPFAVERTSPVTPAARPLVGVVIATRDRPKMYTRR